MADTVGLSAALFGGAVLVLAAALLAPSHKHQTVAATSAKHSPGLVELNA